jgi:hypothetical protein
LIFKRSSRKIIKFSLIKNKLKGTSVTAIHTFSGIRSEQDLSFEQGDIIKIINRIKDDPKWAFAEINKRKGFIPLNYVKPIL